jgi:prepilin-type N-terminal cleavage/methylation domain-containing protein
MNRSVRRRSGASRLWRARPAGGFSLVEVLVTIAIMGIVAVVMIQAMTAIVINSARNRDASIGEVELRRFAEKVRAAPYLTCGTPEGYNTSNALRDDLAALPAGMTIGVTNVEFWVPPADPDPEAPRPPTVVDEFVPIDDPGIDSCDIVEIDDPENPGETIQLPRDDNRLQRLTLQAEVGAYTREVTVVKRWFE